MTGYLSIDIQDVYIGTLLGKYRPLPLESIPGPHILLHRPLKVGSDLFLMNDTRREVWQPQ